jgi:hypothetical protein
MGVFDATFAAVACAGSVEFVSKEYGVGVACVSWGCCGSECGGFSCREEEFGIWKKDGRRQYG